MKFIAAFLVGKLPGRLAGTAELAGRLVCVFMLSLCQAAPGQTHESVVLTGTVLDPSRATVGGAMVSFRAEGQPERSTMTLPSGRFSISLEVGSYALRVVAPGFVTYEQQAIQLVAGRPVNLSIDLRIAVASEEVTVGQNQGASTDPDANRSALVFKGAALDALATRDDDLQRQLIAMAGGDGQHPPQVLVDGFSGGRFPPKASIREVRINEDPFSAQYDSLGFGRIEIFTKPGANQLHGSFQLNGNTSDLNSRNPYTGAQPPYHSILFDGSLDGPLGKKTSFFMTGNTYNQQENSVINAVGLDAGLHDTSISQAIASPTTTNGFTGRLDRQFGASNTFIGKYQYTRTDQTNAGVGLLVLASQAYASSATIQTLQLGDTITVGPHIVNEVRFQYIRTRSLQAPNDASPSIVVEGAFNGGGNSSQIQRDNQDSYEFQNYLSYDHKHHFVRTGLRYRLMRDSNLSTANFNGQFVFPDINTYRITQQGVAEGLSPAAIRAAGGGASLFNLAAGRSNAAVVVGDVGAYFEDDWKLRKDLTLSAGLRFESQTAIPDHVDPAPRLALAWSIGGTDKKPAVWVLRLGAGLFYDRFLSGNILQTRRQNGVFQQNYLINHPDFYPLIPSPATLTGSTPSTIYQLSPRLRSPYAMVATVTLERTLGKYGSVATNYLQTRGVHQLLSRNINAPLPGTYDPSNPLSGVRPFGGTNNLYQFSSDGIGNGSFFFTNMNLNLPRHLNLFAFYILGSERDDTGGASAFPSNQYNLAADYGRSASVARHQLYLGFSRQLPFGLEGGTFLAVRSGQPFNITTGTDLNGDTQFNDRPAFATDMSRPSVRRTALGTFDTQPTAGQKIIPINYGMAPGQIFLQVQLLKSFKIGPYSKPSKDAPPPPTTTGKVMPPSRAWDLSFGADVQNALNHTNPGVPVGVLSSPFFGKSISLQTLFSSSASANRSVNFRSAFRF